MAVNFGGKSTRIPSVMTDVNTAGLIRGGVAAEGSVGIIGLANSGPVNEIVTLLSPTDAKAVYNSGSLLESGNEAWIHGAQTVKLLRVGDGAAPATMTLTSSTTALSAINSLTLTSIDKGNIYNEVQVKVESYNSDKKITLNYYDIANNKTISESFTAADIDTMVSLINTPLSMGGRPSTIVTATKTVSAEGILNNISSTKLTGGNSGSVTNISSAIQAFEGEDVNILLFDHTINDLTSQALLLAHCNVMADEAKERICLLGHDQGAAIGDQYTSGSIINKAYTLNSKRAVVVTPGTDGKSSGLTAAKVAGMMMKYDAAEPMTHKVLQVSTIETKYSRSVLQSLIQYGLIAIEDSFNGRRIARGITTIQDLSATVEDPYKELSIVTAIDYVVTLIRKNLDVEFIGKKGVSGVESSIQNSISDKLGALVSGQIISNFRNVVVNKNQNRSDMFDVTLELIPMFPINFITVTFSLQNS